MNTTYYECLGWFCAERFLFYPPNRSKFRFLIPLLGLTFCARYMGYIKTVDFFIFFQYCRKNINLTLIRIFNTFFDRFFDRFGPFMLRIRSGSLDSIGNYGTTVFSTVLSWSTFRQFYCMFLCTFLSTVLLYVLYAIKSTHLSTILNRHILRQY